ncbi:hypothetical protein [Pseudaminobacter salicylatoxidans]|uniref:hypothetical protein n=1 Tax=Pseudaminobacter salicylatoxidans TaxID=93369 RepID=UPI0012F64B43|nr:hypothetical protein [Pseudaminobacter salicylatoxidans]
MKTVTDRDEETGTATRPFGMIPARFAVSITDTSAPAAGTKPGHASGRSIFGARGGGPVRRNVAKRACAASGNSFIHIFYAKNFYPEARIASYKRNNMAIEWVLKEKISRNRV